MKQAIEIILTGGKPTLNDKDIKKVEEIVNDLYENPLVKNVYQELRIKKGVEAQFRALSVYVAEYRQGIAPTIYYFDSG